MSAIIAGQVARAGFEVGRQGFKASQKLSSDAFTFDFPALIVKLTVFYLIAYAVSKIFEAIIFGQNTLFAFARLFGVNLPSTLPEPLVNFFQEGIKGVKYWDIVKVISILLVVMEWNNWNQTQKALRINPSPMTQGVFFVIISALILITVPELFQRFKELRAMNTTIEEPTNDFRQRDVR